MATGVEKGGRVWCSAGFGLWLLGALKHTRFPAPPPITPAADKGEDRAAVLHSLHRLKTVDRETLVAFYIRGHSLKQMSREFETPVGTIKRRLHVARLVRIDRVLLDVIVPLEQLGVRRPVAAG
jgi:hypothetical protein